MADLGSIEFSIQANTSKLDDVVTAVGKVEAAVKGLQSSFDDMGSKASSSAGNAKNSTNDLSGALEAAAVKGKLFADALESGLSKVADLVSSAAKSFEGFVESSVQSYASFEQAYGAAERFFQKSASGYKGGRGVMEAYNDTIGNSSASLRDVGVSMSDFFDLSNSLMPRLVKDNTEARVKMEYEAQNGMIETVEAKKDALDSELSLLKANLNSQYDVKREEYSKDESTYKEQLDSKYDDDKAYWDQRLTEFKRANEDTYNARKDELDKEEAAYKQELANELTAFKRAKSDEYDALKDALTENYNQEKSARESSREQLKQQLSDEYDDLKDSLDNQYDLLKSSLDKQVDAQTRANERAYTAKKRQLDDEYDDLKDALDKEVAAYQAATDARIAEINREYAERYKLIDEEKYKALKEISDQISALDRQTELESRAQREREYNEKLSKLELKMISAKSHEERIQAEQDYNDTLSDLNAYRRRNEVADQKDELRQRSDELTKYYDGLKSQLKEEQSEEVSAYESHRSNGLRELRDHNANVLAEKKRANEDALKQLKQDQSDQIALMKENEKQILAAEKSREESILKSKNRANADIINQQKQADAEYLRQLQSDNAEQLKEVQRANDDEIGEYERSNKDKLSEMQKGNKNELTQLHRDLDDQYTEYENSVKKKLKEIKSGYDQELDVMKAEHKKQLDELREYNRKVAEEETQKTKAAKKSVTGDEWKKDLNLTPTAKDYDKSMEQIKNLASMIADADAATDKGMSRVKLSILGGLYGRYATFDELNLPYRNKTGVQEMIEDAYAATRNVETRKSVYGSEADPFEGLELSADNAAAYLQALTWAFKENNYEGLAAEEASSTLSGAWRTLVADGENLQTVFAMSDKEAKEFGISLDELVDDSIKHLETFLFGNGKKEGDDDYFGGLVERVSQVLTSISDMIDRHPEVPKKLAELLGKAAGFVGEALMPLLESILNFFVEHGGEVATAFYTAFTDNIPEESPLKGVLDSIEAITTAISTVGPLVAGVFVFSEAAQGVAALGGISTAIGGIGTAIGGLATGVTVTFGEIGAAIALAFEAFTTSEGITTGIGLIGETIAEVFGIDGAAVSAVAGFAGPAALGLLIAANKDVQRIVGEVFGGLAGVIGGAIDACSPMLNTFKVTFDTIEGAISVVVRTLETLFRPAFEAIGKMLSPIMNDIGTKFKQAWEDLNEAIQKTGDFFGRLLEPAFQDLAKLLSPVVEGIGMIVGYLGATFLGLLDGIVTLFGSFTGWLKDMADALDKIEDPWGAFTGYMKGLPEAIGKAISDAGAAISKFLDQVKSDITGYFEKAGEWLGEAGKNVIEGFVGGAKEIWTGVIGWFGDLGDKIIVAVKDALGIHSPSTKMAEVGKFTIEGFFSGITEAWKPVADFFGGILGTILGFFDDPVGTLVGVGGDIIGGLKGGVDGAWTAVQSFFGGVQDEVKGDFDGSDKWLDKSGEMTIDGYKAGIDKSYQVVSKFFGGIDGDLDGILANSDKYLTEEGKEVIKGLKDGIDNKYQNVNAFFTDMPNEMKKKFDSSDRWLNDGGKSTIGGYHSGMKEEWKTVDTYLSDRGSKVSAKFSNSSTLLNTAGWNVISGFYDGLVDAWNNSGLKGFVTDIADWIEDNKGPESKDKALLVPAGNWIIGGLYGSMEDSFEGDVMPFVTSMADQMKNGFDDVINIVRELSTRIRQEFKEIATDMSETLSDFIHRTKDMLMVAGRDIIASFIDGMMAEWQRGKEFIYEMTDWIKDNKGPKEKDLKLLTPAGRWIMGGLRDGLEDAFRRDVMPLVSSMAGEMERGFGSPTLVANAKMLSAGTNGMGSGMFGMGAPQVIVQHMEVRSERDIHSVSRELNELWQMEMSGSLI